MTNDELLAKLLDNSLTDAERQELSARMASSPQFAEEVREYLAVEDVLLKSRSALVPGAPLRLLDTVETTMAATIAEAGTAATGATAVGRSFLPTWLLTGIATVLVVGGAAYFLSTSDNEPATPPSAVYSPATPGASLPPDIAQQAPTAPTGEPTATPQEIQQAEQPATTDIAAQHAVTPQERSTTPVPQHDTAVVPSTPSTTVPATSTPDDGGTLSMSAQESNRKLREQLGEQLTRYTEFSTAGNTIGRMSTAKRIGILYRSLNNFESSRQYLAEALSLATTLKLQEEGAVITGEIGLLEQERGAHAEAVTLVERCVETLKSLNSPQLRRWTTILTELKNK